MSVLGVLSVPRTVEEIADKCGMNPRKVYRLLATLPELGTQVEVEEERRSGRGRPIRRYYAPRSQPSSIRTWFYQIAQWSQRIHVRTVKEGMRITWPLRRKATDVIPRRGDYIVLFRVPTGNKRFGVCGWGKVLNGSKDEIEFEVLPPSNQLALEPWSSPRVKQIADTTRGRFKQGTLWLVDRRDAQVLRKGISDAGIHVGARGGSPRRRHRRPGSKS